MIEHEFPYESFIGGWYMSERICDNLIKLFNDNKNFQRPGKQRYKGVTSVNKTHKESTDFPIDPKCMIGCIGDYRKALQVILEKYNKKYPDSDKVNFYNIKENFVIQHYNPGGGYKQWHSERGDVHTSSRILVFMTYLNDVDDGGTYFKNQKLLVPAKKGLTLIWPTDWTHTHKGQISHTKEKYIITGWFNFL